MEVSVPVACHRACLRNFNRAIDNSQPRQRFATEIVRRLIRSSNERARGSIYYLTDPRFYPRLFLGKLRAFP